MDESSRLECSRRSHERVRLGAQVRHREGALGGPWGLIRVCLGILGQLLAGLWAPWDVPLCPLWSYGTVPCGPLEALKDGLPVAVRPLMILGVPTVNPFL